MKRVKLLVAALMVLALGIALVSAQSVDESAQVSQDSNTLVDVVVRAANGNPAQFTVLLAALEAADPIVLETLGDANQRLTVFAPADRVFEALPSHVIDALLNDTELLTQILLYHVLPVRSTSSDIANTLESNGGAYIINTLQDETVTILQVDPYIFINESFLRVDGGVDFYADNGVLHILDGLLIPPSVADDVAALIAGEESASEEVAAEEVEELGPAGAEEINSAIGRLYAAGSGSSDAEEAVEEEPAEPAPARAEEINSAIGRLYAAGRGSADTEEAEDTEAEASEASTIAEWVLGREGFDTLSLILTAAATDYLEDLSDASAEYTLFAPTDDAFNALGAALGIDVSAAVAFPDILIDILGYHIVEGAVPAEVVLTLDGQSVATVQGESVAIAVVDGSVVLNGRVTVTVTDVVTGNGVIHVVDAVLISQSTVETLASLGLTLP